MPCIPFPFYDQDQDNDLGDEYDKYEDHGYDQPERWPTPKPFDGPEFDDEVPF